MQTSNLKQRVTCGHAANAFKALWPEFEVTTNHAFHCYSYATAQPFPTLVFGHIVVDFLPGEEADDAVVQVTNTDTGCCEEVVTDIEGTFGRARLLDAANTAYQAVALA